MCPFRISILPSCPRMSGGVCTRPPTPNSACAGVLESLWDVKQAPLEVLEQVRRAETCADRAAGCNTKASAARGGGALRDATPLSGQTIATGAAHPRSRGSWSRFAGARRADLPVEDISSFPPYPLPVLTGLARAVPWLSVQDVTDRSGSNPSGDSKSGDRNLRFSKYECKMGSAGVQACARSAVVISAVCAAQIPRLSLQTLCAPTGPISRPRGRRPRTLPPPGLLSGTQARREQVRCDWQDSHSLQQRRRPAAVHSVGGRARRQAIFSGARCPCPLGLARLHGPPGGCPAAPGHCGRQLQHRCRRRWA